jgi:hypothetical protein
VAGIASLIVKIGAQDAEITAALAKLGTNVKRTEDEFKKLGATPIAQRAQQSLQTLDETIKGIQTSQSRLADRAKLAAAGIEAMGGPARLTARELEQVNRVIKQGLDAYRALGQEAPKELQKVSAAVEKQRKDLSAGAGAGKGGGLSSLLGLTGIGAGALSAAGVGGTVVALAKGALDAADNLTKLSDRTGIAIEGLQRLQAVAEPSGNSLDQVASAVNQFQKRLSEGSKDTVSALGEIGLSIGQLRALSPDEQFFAIANGIQSIKDPAEQTRIAMELFGKSGAELLPTLKADIDGLKDSTLKMSTESAKAWDDLGDAILRWKGNAIAAIGEVGGQILRLRTEGGPEFGFIMGLFPALGANLVGNTAGAAVSKQFSSVGLPNFAQNLPEVARRSSDRSLGPQGGSFQSSVSAIQAQIELERGLASALKQSEAAVKAATAAEQKRAQVQRQHEADLAKFAAAQLSVTASIKGYLTVADTVDGATVESIRYLRDHGAAMSDLATYYGLTAQQADAVARKLDFEATVAKAAAGIHAKLATSIYDTGKALDKLNSIPDRTRIPTLQAGPNPSLPRSFGQNFGDMLRTSLPQAINNAIQGGGSILEAAGSTLGGFLVSEKGFGKQLSGGLTKLFGKGVGDAISALLPGIGAMLGPLLDKIGKALKDAFGGPSQQEMEGRDAQASFQSRFGSFDEMVNRIGDAYAATGRSREDAQRAVQEMLDAERQGADAVNAAIANLQGTLDAADRLREGASRFGPSQSQRNEAVTAASEVYDYMVRLQAQGEYTQEQVNQAYLAYQQALADAGDEAAKAWLATQGTVTGGVTAVTNAMQSQIDTLQKSIANEAPEAVKGAIETQVEGQIAALKSQMEAQQSGLEELAGASAEDTVQALEDAFDGLELHARIVYDWPVGGGVEPNPVARGGLVVPGGVQYFDRGGRVLPFLPKGTDTVPAMLTPGEIVINAAQQGRIASALVGGGGTTTVILEADGRTLAELMVPHVPGALKRYRVA